MATQRYGFLFSFLVTTLLISLVSGAQGGTEPIVIRFSHVVAEDTPKGIGART